MWVGIERAGGGAIQNPVDNHKTRTHKGQAHQGPSQDLEHLKKRVLGLQKTCHTIFIELIEEPVEKIRGRNL